MKRIALVFISGTLLTKMFWAVLGCAEISAVMLELCRALGAGTGWWRALPCPQCVPSSRTWRRWLQLLVC